MRISISGPPGSGKTTAARGVAKNLGLKLILTGNIFRAMAAERNMSLEDFGILALEDSSIDKELDKRVLKKFVDNTLLEGRLSGALAKINDIIAFKVYIDASVETRAVRVRYREGGELEAIINDIEERNRVENERYMSIYGVDPSNHSIYDFVISTDLMPASEVSDIISKRAVVWEGRNVR
ncbi:MAG TPA: AAA family ATPase [Euryarchaeota archaeon]|nr:AAA family ATPase [Euryarchaeota archaeon]